MKIGIFSDSHDNIPKIRLILNKMKEAGVEKLIHAGDIISPFIAPIIGEYNMELYVVTGNNDGEKHFLKEMFSKIGHFYEDNFIVEIANKKFVVMHKPFFIDEIANSGKYDVIVYGHTHKYDIRKIGNTHVINPGESCGYLTGKATFVIFDTEKDEAELLEA